MYLANFANFCFCFVKSEVDCEDGGIFVTEGHWMGFDGDMIISAICPASYCCQLDECDYLKDPDSLCAPYRDHESFLCGKCKDGYSESVMSENCMKCNRAVEWEYLLLPIAVMLILLPILLLTNRVKNQRVLKRSNATTDVLTLPGDSLKGSVVGNVKRLKTGESKITLMSLAKIIIYYQQSVSQILSASAETFWGAAFVAFFDFSVQQMSQNASTDSNDWCFIDGLHSRDKIILDLIAPAMICITMMMIFLISKFVVRKPISIKNREVNFEAAGLAVFLLTTGRVLDTLFKMLSCKSIGPYYVHFYFGYEECGGLTWIVSLIALLVIITSFGAIFFFGRKMSAEQRADENTFMYQLSSRFKPEFWYWEYIIFLRRLTVAFFAVGVSGDGYKLIFGLVMMMFIGLQWHLAPFLTPETNRAEFILLCAIPIVIMALMPSVEELPVSEYVMSMLVLLPIPLMAFFARKVVQAEWEQWKFDHHAARRNSRVSGLVGRAVTEMKNEGIADKGDAVVTDRKGTQIVYDGDGRLASTHIEMTNDSGHGADGAGTVDLTESAKNMPV